MFRSGEVHTYTHTPRVRTAYDQLVPLHNYYIAVGQRPPRDFRSQLSIQTISPTSLLLIRVYKTNRFVCHEVPPDVASSDLIHCPHTLLYCRTRTDGCRPSPFVDPTMPRKRENGLKQRQICVYAHVCVLLLSLLYW